MNYEEKLNLAKKALESGSYDTETIEYIFPELKESEDEKIRNLCEELVRTCFMNELCTKEDKDECIAWLEKQGDTNETINRDEFAQCVLRGAAINLINWIDYNTAKGNMCLSNTECKIIEGALVFGDWDKIYAYIKRKLEKQGEQKPINDTDEEIVEAVKDTSILDMVEPKFKVGDKIENRFSSHRVYDIIGVDLDNQEYHCKHSYCNNEEYLPFEYADKDYELYDDTPTPPDYGDEVKFEPKIYDSVFYYNKGEIKTGKIVDYRADEGVYELDNGVELLPNEIIGIGK